MSLMRKGSFGTEPQDRAQEQILDQVVHAMEQHDQHAELALSFRKNACKCGEFLPYSTMSPLLSHSKQHIYKSCLACTPSACSGFSYEWSPQIRLKV